MPISSPAGQRDCAEAALGANTSAAFAISAAMIVVLDMISAPI
jgi:hypothetical protein